MKKLLLTSSCAAIALVQISPAVAQEVRGPEGSSPTSQAATPASTAEVDTEYSAGLEDIVVTARKISEDSQKVPVAVTFFSGAELQNQSAVRISDISRLTPSLRSPPTNSPGGRTFIIRGQIGGDAASQDSAVGVYVDGLYWARAVGLDVDLLDVQSVQVLKGPQGTLFGRNTTGGAILLQSNDPTFDGVSGLVSATYGRFNERNATGVLNLPLIDDKLSVRVAGSVNKRDGYLRNIDGTDLVNRDNWNVRGKLLFRPTEDISLLFLTELFRSDNLNQPNLPVFIGPNSALNFPVGVSLFGPVSATATVADRTAQGAAYFQTYIQQSRSGDTSAIDYLTRVNTRTETYSGTLTIDTWFGAVKVIAGYRSLDSQGRLDFDTTPAPVLYLPYNQQVSQLSVEPQITGKMLNGAVDFAAGLFYFHESGNDDSPFFSFSRSPATSPTITLNQQTNFNGVIRTQSMGIYSQASWHVNDRLTFTGGFRYSVDDKGITNRNKTASGGCALAGQTPPACEFNRDDDFTGISYLAGVDYQITPDVLAYAKVSRGYRSGGQNLRATGNIASTRPFGPETIKAYEIGFKTQFLDRKVRLNLAGYLNIADDLQRATVTAIVVGGVTSATSIQSNFGKARFAGAEAELTARVSRDLTLSANAAYIDASYISFIDPGTGIDRRGELFTNPKFTFAVAADYTREFDFGKFFLRSDYSHDSSRQLLSLAFSPVKDPLYDQKIAATRAGASGVLNGRVGVTVANDALDVAAFIRNATDNRGATHANSQPFDLVTTLRREPRTYGVTATLRFGAR